MAVRIHLQAPISEVHGYGRDGVGLTRALMKAGSYVTLQPTQVITPIPEDISKVLTHQHDKPWDFFLSHVHPHALTLPDEARDFAYKKIAWTMWEFSTLGDQSNIDLVKKCLEGYDLVLGYDDVTVKALRETGTDTRIEKLQGGYEPDVWASEDGQMVERNWFADEFVFVIAGELSPRKNPYVLCRALKSLYEEGYKFKLIMKNKFDFHLPPRMEEVYPFLTIYNGTWPVSKIKSLYESAHCYVGPSTGEGKNLPPIEAGTTGAAMILSDIPGHREWAREEFATFVGGKMNYYDAGAGRFQVDEDELREACRDLMDNRLKAQKMGRLAHDILPATLSWDSVVRKLQNDYLSRI